MANYWKVVIKSWVKHVVFVLLMMGLSKLLFNSLVLGYVFGVGCLCGWEFSQVTYRIFSLYGKRWETLSVKDYLKLEVWRAKRGGLVDTLGDVLVPMLFGGLLVCVLE